MATTINIVQFGKETPISLGDGATYADVLAAIPNGKNLDVREGGVSIQEKAGQQVPNNARLTAAPRQVKQG